MVLKRKWRANRFGVEALDPASEFLPRKYKVRVFDLKKLGVPTVPVIGQSSFRRLHEPSDWHVHERCIEFIYCAAGACEYESQGRRYRLQSGMLFVSRAEEEHRQLMCPKGYANLYLLFEPSKDPASQWFATMMAKLPRLFPCGRSVPARFAKVFALAQSDRPAVERTIRLQTEIHSLFLDILDAARSGRTARRAPMAVDRIAARMRQFPERDYPLAELVAESGLSRASFMSHFKTACGYTPHAYHLFCRVEAAKAHLRRGLTASEVAVKTGFATAQNLARAFRNFAGLTPRQWSARNRA